MADQPGHTAPLGVFLSAAIPATAALLLVLVLCLFHFTRHYKVGIMTGDAMDTVQAARYMAQTGDLGTNIIRPLLTASQTSHGDGTLPDLAHPPLHLALCAVLMRITHHTSLGFGDQDAVLVSLACFIASLGACYLLYTRCFGYRNALLACLMLGMGGSALIAALTARPTLLAAFLFTLVLVALFNADKSSALSETAVQAKGKLPPSKLLRQSTLWAGAAGFLFGLLYLSAYSTLILIVPLVVSVWLNARRKALPPLAFLIGALVITAPVLWHHYKASGFPFYNTRLIEFAMNTETYPGYSLYRAANLPLPLTQYLAQGGLSEVLQKAANNLVGFYGRAPYILGTFLVPLLLGSALIRFADSRVNRLRGLLFACIGLHLLGLSLFQPYDETAPLLLMYAPAASVIGIGFLLSVVRARNLPRFYRQAAITGWMLVACVPGFIQLTAPPLPEGKINTVYYFLNTDSAQMQVMRSKRTSLLVSDAPWELAFRCDYPAVWLPQDGSVMQTVAERTGRPVDGVVLAGDVRVYDDKDALPWQLLINRLAAVADLTGDLDMVLRTQVLKQVRLYYPQELAAGLNGFVPQQRQRDGVNYPLLLWNQKLLRTVSAGGRK